VITLAAKVRKELDSEDDAADRNYERAEQERLKKLSAEMEARGGIDRVLLQLSLGKAAALKKDKKWPARAKPPAADFSPANVRQKLGRIEPRLNGQQGPVAVLSNDVDSISHRQEKRSLIRRPKPEFDLTYPGLNATRLLLELLFRVRAKHDNGFKELKFSIPELGRSIGLEYRMSRQQAETLLDNLSSVVFTYRGAEGTAWVPCMAISKLDHGADIARLKLNAELEPYLLDLRSYRRLHRSVFKLRSPSAVLLYVYLRRFIGLKQRRHRVPFAALTKVMWVDKGWHVFRRDNLQPAIAEINRETELKVDYSPERGGHRKRGEVEAVIFELSEKDGSKELDKLLENKEPDTLIRPRKTDAERRAT